MISCFIYIFEQIQPKNYFKYSVVLVIIENECNYSHFIQDRCVSVIKLHINYIRFR